MNKNTNETPLLEVKNLKTYFPIAKTLKGNIYLRAVEDVSLYVEEGETLGIIGESGSGKSTLGNSIIRMVEPTEGNVFYQGENITNIKLKEFRSYRKDIQMIFQDPFSSLNPRMRVFDIIAEPLRTHKMVKGKELKETVYNLLNLVGLDEDVSRRFPHEFSGGQRQRVGIARAIALKPKIIICDEPVSSLDVSIQAQILNLLRELQKELNLTYIFIAHGIPAVQYLSDRIAVMYMGEIIETTTKDQLFETIRHPYTKKLYSSVPSMNPKERTIEDADIQVDEINHAENDVVGCKYSSRCPIAQDYCRKVKPELRELTPNHYVRCHYPLGDK